MSCCEHDHEHSTIGHIHGATSGRGLWISLVVTLAFVIGEAIAGTLAHSLALVSDAGHNLTDALALGLAAFALSIARRPADARRTFGYHRVAILSALFNALSLIGIAVAIMVEAVHLFRHPQPVNSGLMMAVAAISVVMNTVVAGLLASGAKHSLNIRAAYLHMAGDALSAVAVLLAGWIVRQTGWQLADPLVSLLIAAFLMVTSWGVLRDATNILLEGTPRDLDMDALVRAMRQVPHVGSVHDLHVWTVGDGRNFLACHVVVEDTRTLDECSALIGVLSDLLAHDFGIAHTTIQTENARACTPDIAHTAPLYCADGRRGELAAD